MVNLADYLGYIYSKLTENFDISENYSLLGRSYEIFARMNVNNEKFILLPEIKLYGFHNNEYFLIRRWDHPDSESLREELRDFKTALPSLIERKKDHMSSALIPVLVTEAPVPPETEKLVRKFFYQKGFALGFKGWADLTPVIVSLSDGRVIAHNKIRKTAEFFKPELSAQSQEVL